MALLGQAAMILAFDVAAEAIAEHDDWHSREHLPERLSIPGFRRGSRWLALAGAPRYFVLYEVDALATLESAPYLERLNHPSPWTSRMMPHYRGMKRGLCTVLGSCGAGLGRVGLLLRFSPAAGSEPALRDALLGELMPELVAAPGVCSAHLCAAALPPAMTREQAIRGADGAVDWVLLVTGYDAERVARLSENALSAERLAARGASATTRALYQLDVALTDREVEPAPAARRAPAESPL